MLAYLLAFVVGLGSLAIYLSAFFFPEIHRKNDFIWSGVGMFYALVLWIFAPQIVGGLLLGHVASVALLVWFGWQTLSLRRQLTPEVQQTAIPSPESVKVRLQEQTSKLSFLEKLKQLPVVVVGWFNGLKAQVQQTLNQKSSTTPEKPAQETLNQTTAEAQSVPETSEIPVSETQPAPESSTSTVEEIETSKIPVSETQTMPESSTPTVEDSEVTEEITPENNPETEVVSDDTSKQLSDPPSEKSPPSSEAEG
ncbi:MAG: hypothetical protein F6K61_00665 [Sphaerospermopsis sp. SIO1G1]|nr:hypothetical protein [Sphaerospermopsis sp. SIO1G1]